MIDNDYVPPAPTSTPAPCDGQPWRPVDGGGVECLTTIAQTGTDPFTLTVLAVVAVAALAAIVLGSVLLVRSWLARRRR